MMAFSGMRSSCDMLARNSVLGRLALSKHGTRLTVWFHGSQVAAASAVVMAFWGSGALPRLRQAT